MRVLHLVKTTRGAAWALAQIRCLIAQGCEIHVVLPDADGLAGAYREAGAQVHVLNVDIAQLRHPTAFLRSVLAFRRLVRDLGPDLIHSHFVGTTLFMRVALLGGKTPRVFQVPGPLHLESLVTRLAEIGSASRADAWIATCRKTKDCYLQAGIDESRVFLTFYGTDVHKYSPASTDQLRPELGLAPGTRIVGMVAYAYPPKIWLGQKRGIKGHEDLIDAMAIVARERADVVCVFTGGAWGHSSAYYDSIVAYGKARLGERAIFLGTRSDIDRIYPSFDLVVHPSHSENLGGAAESLLMGVPTLATNIGGFPDIVHHGETGWLTPSGDPAAMARAIVAILDDPQGARRRAIAGRQLAVRELDVTKTSNDVLQFYRSILGR